MRYLATLLFLAATTPAFACPVLEKADPRVGSITASPSQVTLYFSGIVFPAKSTLKVVDAAGKDYARGAPSGSGDQSKIISVPVNPLAPGRYQVKWNVLCDCDSMNPGSYPFTVK